LGHFSYKGVDQAGGRVTGTIEAADRRSAVAALADQGRFVTELAEQARSKAPSGESAKPFEWSAHRLTGGTRISSKELMTVTTQLSTALRAGLPLLNCLELIRNQQRKVPMQRLFERLVKSVSSGKSLSDAMAENEGVFSPLYLSMIRVGETGGILEQTTSQLATILGREEKVKSGIKSALAYPTFILVLGILSVILIVTVIVPRILATIDVGIAGMPLPTRMLMGFSGAMRALFTSLPGWIFLAAMIVGFGVFWKWTRTAGRAQWDAFKLKIPVLGTVLRTIAVGRFARTLGALTQGGVTILEALGVVRDTLGNEVLGRQIDEVAEKVKRGESLADPLEVSGCFPPLLVQIVAIGEQTGKLDELLLNAAEVFDTDADAAVNRFLAVFPPALILLLAVLIGFIVAATLLPIMMMSAGVGGL
jgi:type II secretory pathway component PulF